MIIEVNGRQYKKIKRYPHFTLFEDTSHGFKECFTDYDLGLVEIIPLLEVKKRISEQLLSKGMKNE